MPRLAINESRERGARDPERMPQTSDSDFSPARGAHDRKAAAANSRAAFPPFLEDFRPRVQRSATVDVSTDGAAPWKMVRGTGVARPSLDQQARRYAQGVPPTRAARAPRAAAIVASRSFIGTVLSVDDSGQSRARNRATI